MIMAQEKCEFRKNCKGKKFSRDFSAKNLKVG